MDHRGLEVHAEAGRALDDQLVVAGLARGEAGPATLVNLGDVALRERSVAEITPGIHQKLPRGAVGV
jgi:hypothetical protein